MLIMLDLLVTGASDFEIAKYCKRKQSILITKDIEFGNTILYPNGSHYGLLILRFPFNFNIAQITNNLINFLINIKTETLVNSIVILELGKYRRRNLVA